jgi:methionyl-tRNA synthetase
VNEQADAKGAGRRQQRARGKLVDELKGFNYLDYYGGKFSPR